jgi:osmotically-inducible protein OsmY
VTAEVEHELRTGPWLARSSVGVRVENGVATLEGIIHDEPMRDAIRVAVQNVPGVIAVRDRIVFVEPLSGSIMPA